MKKMFLFTLVVFSSLILYACGSVKNNDNEVSIRYIENIEIKQESVYKYVGESFILNSSIAVITPYNATEYNINVSDNTIADYNANSGVVETKKAGVSEIVLTGQLSDGSDIIKKVVLTVQEKPAYAVSIVANENVELNYNSYSKDTYSILENIDLVLDNDKTIKLKDYEFLSDTKVNISDIDVINFDPLTGVITPKTSGTSKVKLTLKTGKYEYALTKTIDLKVTNYVYADSFVIDGISEDDYVDEVANISMFTNSQLKLKYYITPFDYNKDIIISISNSNIKILNDGTIVSNSTEIFDCILTIKMYKNKTEFTTRKLNLIVENKPELYISLTDLQANNVSKVFVGDEYNLIINSTKKLDVDSIDKVLKDNVFYDFYNLEKFEFVERITDNTTDYFKYKTKIVFSNASNVVEKICLTYNVNSFNESFDVLSNIVDISVYNPIDNFNIYLSSYDKEMVSTSNIYDLFIIDKTNIEKAKIDKIDYYANIQIFALGSDILTEHYEINFYYNNVKKDFYNSNNFTLNNNQIMFLPSSIGQYKIEVVSKDFLKNSSAIYINTSEYKPNKVLISNVVENKIILYLNSSNESFSDKFELNINVLPEYSFNKNFSFNIIDNNIVELEDNVITAKNIGATKLEIKTVNNVFYYDIEVETITNTIMIDYNGVLYNIDNLYTIVTTMSDMLTLKFFAFSNAIEMVGLKSKISLLDENGLVIEKSNILNCEKLGSLNNWLFKIKNLGMQKVMFEFENTGFYKQYLLEIKSIYYFSEISDFIFEHDIVDLNLFYTNEVTNYLDIIKNDENDYDVSRISYFSSDDNIELKFVNGQLTLNVLFEKGYKILNKLSVDVTIKYENNLDIVLKTYTINIHYTEPTTYIENIVFGEDSVSFNVYDIHMYQNTYEIYLENEEFEYTDEITYKLSSSDYAEIDSDGLVSFNKNAVKSVGEVSFRVILVVTNAIGTKEYSYLVNLYYTEPTTYIENIVFGKDSVSFNVYNIHMYQNTYEIYLENEEFEYTDEITYKLSSSEYAEINTDGLVTFNKNAVKSVGVVSFKVIMVVTNDIGVKEYSYLVNLHYTEPITYIENVVFGEDSVSFNVYDTDMYQNTYEIYLENEEFEYTDEITYKLSSSEYAEIDSDGLVLFNKNAVKSAGNVSFRVILVVTNAIGTKEYSYLVNLYYTEPTTYIENVVFGKDSVSFNVYDTDMYQNTYEIYLENENFEYSDKITYKLSSSEYAEVDSDGLVSFNKNAVKSVGEVSFRVILVVTNAIGTKEYSYLVNLYYTEPITYIENVVFREDSVSFNVYDTDMYQNTYEIYLENENFEYTDKITYKLSSSDYAEIDSDGLVLFNKNAVKSVGEVSFRVILVVTNAIGTKEYSYLVNLYYTEPTTYIENVVFGKDSVSFNVYDTDMYQNTYEIILENENFEYTDKITYKLSSSDYAEIDSDGLVSFNRNAVKSAGSVSFRVILVVTNSIGVKEYSYLVNLYYTEPFAEIVSISYEKEVININIDEINSFSFDNVLTVMTNNKDLKYNENLLYTYSSNNDLIKIINLNQFEILSEVYNLTESVGVVVTTSVTDKNLNISAAFIINFVYTEKYDEIGDIKFDSNQLVLYKKDSIDNLTIAYEINSGSAGKYNMDEIEFVYCENIKTLNVFEGRIEISLYSRIHSEITIKNKNTNEIYDKIEISFVLHDAVYTYNDLINIKNDNSYVLMNNIAINNVEDNETTIKYFNGIIDGNGYEISGLTKPLFEVLGRNAIVKNLKIKSSLTNGKTYSIDKDLFSFDGDQLSHFTNASLTIYNLGVIENIMASVEISAYNGAYNIAGLVSVNLVGAKIINSNIYYNAIGNNMASFGGICYENYGEIAYTNVVAKNIYSDEYESVKSYVSGFKYVGAYVYYNYYKIDFAEVFVLIEDSNGDMFVGAFVYQANSKTYNNILLSSNINNVSINAQFIIISSTRAYWFMVRSGGIYNLINGSISSNLSTLIPMTR